MASAAAALLAVISGVVSYRTATAPEETVRLAMAPFASAPEDLTRGIAERLGRLKGSPRTKLSFVHKRAGAIEKARALLGATHVLHGSIENKDGRLLVRAFITDTRSQTPTMEWKADYAPGELRYIPTALAGMVTGTFHLPAPADALVVNVAARQDYTDGLAYLRRETGADAGVAAMQKAVAADPDSPLTHAGLAEAWWWKYTLTKEQKYLDLLKECVRQAERRNPDLPPVHRISGSSDGHRRVL